MLSNDFLKYQAKTTPYPMGMEVKRAKGCYIIDQKGKKYLDFVAGVSACSVGHSNNKIINAIKKQSEKYLHVMVYGEFITEPTLKLAKLLAKHLPKDLNSTYFTNSGTEALEGAIKLARRFTGRRKIIGAKNAYHGSTMGALTLMGLEERKRPFEPLIPEVNFIEFNNFDDLSKIDNNVLIFTFFLSYSIKLAASFLANSIKLACICKSTNLKFTLPDCLLPRTSPGPLKIKSCSEIANPSFVSFKIFNLE